MSDAKKVIVFRTGVLGTWREKFDGIATYAKSTGWSLHTVDARTARPDFEQLVDYWRPSGLILDASGAPEMFNGVDFKGLPAVVMNPEKSICGQCLPSISSDSRLIAKLALSELLELNPSSLMFIEWFEPKIAWSSEKRAVCEEVARMHGVPLAVVTPAAGDDSNPTNLERRISEAIAEMPRPCGIFAVTDAIGAAATSAAARSGADMPGEIAVISVDDDPEICESCTPTLSSVRPDFHRLGFGAGRLLDEAMRNHGMTPRSQQVPPLGVVRRASSRRLRVYDRTVHAALERIRLHACEGLTPGDVAKDFDVSRRMAEMRFKSATGKTLGEEILERRLSVACDYLADGRTSVAAVANFCGWKSDIAFRKAFKSRFGVSPLRWRCQERLKSSSEG